ncbi:MAG: hypothetical protein HYZ53_20260 [Planctomycetes bacterium]|nr:hypothetical protein [Planctomycetota bacterium]
MSESGPGPLLQFWEALAARNEIPLAEQLGPEPAQDHGSLLAVLRGLADRMIADLPDPLPADLFDPASAVSVAAVLHQSAVHLQPGAEEGGMLARRIERVPSPNTAAAHVTQAALGWFALPILRRLRSRGLHGESPAADAPARQLSAFLAARPLLSLREDTEEFFVGEPPPVLDGLEACEGLRRWLVQRLGSPCKPVPRIARRCWTLERIWRTWSHPVRSAREILYLWGRRLGPEPVLGEVENGWLLALSPLRTQNAWPDDLDPAFARRLDALRTAAAPEHEEPPDAGT